MANRMAPSFPDLASQISVEVRHQVEKNRFALLFATVAAMLGIGMIAGLHVLRHIPLRVLTRDIFATTGVPVYIGLLSNLGIMLWAGAAAIWFLNTVLLRRIAPDHELIPLAAASGIVSLVLLFDDSFMLHEDLLPRLLRIPEEAILAAYALGALVYLLIGARRIRNTNYLPCLIAGALLGASLGIDSFLHLDGVEIFVEDGLKFAGIIFWLAYASITSLQVADELKSGKFW
jgi:hypothetical protein